MRASIASLPNDVHDQLVADLRKIVPDLEASHVALLSQHPPAWVEFVTDLITRKNVFKVAATAYLSSLATEAGKTTWASRHKAYKAVAKAATGSAGASRAVYQAVQRASASIGRPVGVVLKAILSDGGVVVSPNVVSVEAFERDFAAYIAALDAIQHGISQMDPKTYNKADWFHCALKSDGFVLKWMDRSHATWEQEFDVEGNISGQRKQLPPAWK